MSLIYACLLAYLFIYLLLHWVLVAACGLSLAAVSWDYSCCVEQASHCGDFSCCEAQALGAWASVVVAHGLSSCGSWSLERRLSSCGTQASCSVACGIFPDQGSNRVPCINRWIFNHCTTREVQYLLFNLKN